MDITHLMLINYNYLRVWICCFQLNFKFKSIISASTHHCNSEEEITEQFENANQKQLSTRLFARLTTMILVLHSKFEILKWKVICELVHINHCILLLRIVVN